MRREVDESTSLERYSSGTKVNVFSYILLTAAKNEEAFIEKTIQSVIAQTVLLRKWVIVSDGSTDRTEEIISQYAAKFDFIEFVRGDGGEQRNFGSKAMAITAGYERVRSIYHDYVGLLDADVSFSPTYYESIMQKFEQNPRLGIAGGIGTRLGCVVKDLPKPMARVSGRPFLKYLLYYIVSQNIKRAILAVGFKHEVIKKHFGKRYKGLEQDSLSRS